MTTVNFCDQCDSLYFIQHDNETNKLSYICRNCGNSEECKEYLIFENDYKKNNKLSYIEELLKQNPDLIHDPSIPKISVPCKNENCKLEGTGDNGVAIIKYDDINLSYIYVCIKCNNYWTNDN